MICLKYFDGHRTSSIHKNECETKLILPGDFVVHKLCIRALVRRGFSEIEKVYKCVFNSEFYREVFYFPDLQSIKKKKKKKKEEKYFSGDLPRKMSILAVKHAFVSQYYYGLLARKKVRSRITTSPFNSIGQASV